MTPLLSRIKELWKYRIFKIAIIIHTFYVVFSILSVILVLKDLSDYNVYYQSAGVFIKNIQDLYNQSNYSYAYRYFPLSPVFYIPFYLMGFELGFILYTIFNSFLCIVISVLLYKIIMKIRGDGHEQGDERVIFYISLFFMGLPLFSNYILGQNNLLVTFMMILSLYLFMKSSEIKMEFIASLVLGISIIIKPITITIIPFLILIEFDYNHKRFNFKAKKSIMRVIGALIPLSLNLIYFLLYPSLWDGFLQTNFTGTNPVDINFSFSLTKLIINTFDTLGVPYSQLLIIAITLLLFGGSGFIFYIFRKKITPPILFGYIYSVLITLIVYFDSWDHHLLTLTPLLIIILFYLPRKSETTRKYIKPGFLFFNFIDLGFFGLFVLIYKVFPFNFVPTIVLILVFYGISRYCIKNKTNDL
jgi:hypothetical protein